VAPEAAQGTALEEDGRPDARPVMDRVALDVENPAGHAKTSLWPDKDTFPAIYIVVIYQISVKKSSFFFGLSEWLGLTIKY
jgi:hypothetical protein